MFTQGQASDGEPSDRTPREIRDPIFLERRGGGGAEGVRLPPLTESVTHRANRVQESVLREKLEDMRLSLEDRGSSQGLISATSTAESSPRRHLPRIPPQQQQHWQQHQQHLSHQDLDSLTPGATGSLGRPLSPSVASVASAAWTAMPPPPWPRR